MARLEKLESDTDVMERFRLLEGLTDAEQQGFLFARILARISSDDKSVPSEDVRRVAHPGLVLRRVTAELITQVLAEPCDITLKTADYAQRIFDQLKREVSLVRIEIVAGEETLVHREDVRREMIRLLRNEQKQKVERIEQAAVAYYKSKSGPLARAEEIYHRLSLKQSAEVLESCWLTVREGLEDPEFKKNMFSALDEFELRAQEWLTEIAWLAPRLGRSLTPEQRVLADLQAWERDTTQRVNELLVRRQFESALSTLRERPERTLASPLFRLEIQVLERESHWDEALQVIERGIASALQAGDRFLAADLTIRAANVNIQLKHFEKARTKLAEAERLSQDDNILPQRLIALKLTHLDLNRLTETEDEHSLELKRELGELFAGLTDEQIIADPLLMQQFAFYLTDQDCPVLRRIVQLNGLGTSRQNSLRQLAHLLAIWDSDQSQRAGERPGVVARRFNIELSDTLTETWTRFALSAEPKQLGNAAAFALDKDAPPSLVQAIRMVLNENLADQLADVHTLGSTNDANVSQSKGGINISGGTINVGGDVVGGDKIVFGGESTSMYSSTGLRLAANKCTSFGRCCAMPFQIVRHLEKCCNFGWTKN